MSTLRLTTTVTATNPVLHDLYLNDRGQLEIIGTDISDTNDYALAVAQSIICRLSMIRGEWYQDQRIGTPWRERIWKKGVTKSTVRRMISDIIVSIPGVRSLDSMNVDIDSATRTVTISDLSVVAETGLLVTIKELDEPMIITAPEDAL